MSLEALLLSVQQSALYQAALLYFAAYPVVTSIMWITTAVVFRLRWERHDDAGAAAAASADAPTAWPFVSVIVPAFDEAAVIAESVGAMLALDYPAYEVIVVDDGSGDGTLDALAALAADPRLRLVRKQRNEGKAMALNDALPLARGEIVLGLDADARPDPMLLHHVVPHFESARVAAVTGNPRVRNTETFVARLQAIEFSSIVSLMRRAQRVWGRIVTVSGVCAAFRRSAVLDVGGFSPDMATEDIELTWKLQKRFYDVRYEPRAICWMTVPAGWRALARQRLRWSRGLMQVLRRHADVIVRWQCRRLWPVFVESALSIAWALCFVVLTTIWLLAAALGLPPVGATPLPSVWGMSIGTVCLVQLAAGAWIDRRYDAGIVRLVAYAVWYPLLYWAFIALTTVASLPWLLRKPRAVPVRWHTPRTGARA
jgi:biofilm PGA synthesis N-glycosyltransferase PgaC